MTTMSTNAAIHINGVGVTFGKKFKALDDVSVKVPQSRITGLIGPSGAGKTTLMRCIVGRQKVTEGDISVFGVPAGKAELRNKVSYKTQEVSVYFDLTVAQNLRYFATMMNLKKDKVEQEVQELLEATDLEPQADQLAGSLSGGQKQRVSLAIALIGKPSLLILDEPTVGLDPVLRDELWQLFRKLADAGATLLVSSHVMDEAERCDDLILIRHGAVVAHQTPQEMLKATKSKTVEESFLKLARGEI